jgi:TonB-linked SusC/RagA family outer membrane protein
VEGGDAVAKYNLSLGYSNDKGILKNTESSRYHTQLNTNILVSKKVEVTTTVGLAYFEGNFQDQGMISQSNPVLAAYARAPILSPYDQDINGNILNTYSPYYFGKSTNMDFSVSNPLAIVNTLDGRNRQYDINIKAGITYKPLAGLSINGSFGLYYNYNKEHLFIPGLTDKSIMPFIDQYGEADNTVKDGVGEAINLFYNINTRYQKVFNKVHTLNISAGAQVLMTKNEFNGGIGRNTANDFYQTLGSTQSIGRYLVGYLEKWNWLNVFGHADYTFAQKVTTSLNVSFDGASSAGTDASKITAYPSLGLTLLGKGWFPLSASTLVNTFNLRAEYGLSGNSRYSSNYGKYYYTSSPYQAVSGIVRANIPNTNLKPERNLQLNLGLDASLFNNRFSVTLDYYNNQASDVIFPVGKSSIYGTGDYFDNLGKIENKGIELSVQASLVRTKHFEWIVGGNIAKNKSVIKSLGTNDNVIIAFQDGAKLINQVGSSPYQFYGYQSLGVFTTQSAADAANLKNAIGNTFSAGDIHYYDKNGDHKIDDKDRVALGDATPDFFGGFYSSLRYKGFTLSAEFTYSKGNDAYNAVRRTLESQSSASNQTIAVLKRWNLEGQAEMPRARWGDPLGNSDFSSRWIEDASYLRMKNITLSFEFDKKFFDFFRGGTFYLTGENLWTTTKYLGLDPEFSYSYSDAVQGFDYAKVMQPKAVIFGVNLKF